MSPPINPMNVSFLQELMTTVAEQGRAMLPKSLLWGDDENIEDLARHLVSSRGEAAGVAIARQILNRYKTLTDDEKRTFLTFLGTELQPDAGIVADAAKSYLGAPDAQSLARLQHAVESPRQEFFRRLNLAPGATSGIVAMRHDLLVMGRGDATLKLVDDDLMHLLASWFNRGFLVLRRIDWQTPAAILEKIIAYEAVHAMASWDDLRRRLDHRDRRCFAYFHPSLIDEPLIFVEVALTHEVSDAIGPLLNEPPKPTVIEAPTTAVFYSISNCQNGLKGISFGNFLIKQVVEDLVRELPSLKTFVTLSPVPGFARWMASAQGQAVVAAMPQEERDALGFLSRRRWHSKERAAQAVKEPLMALAAHYFLAGKAADGKPFDPVARFHLGNGARLDRINYLGDVSPKGLAQSHGVMVNYRYDLKEIEKNHEAFANQGTVAASRAVRSLHRAIDTTAKDAAIAPARALTKLSKQQPAAPGQRR